MVELILILLMVVISILVIIYGVISHFQKIEKQKYLKAAGNIMREDFLNYSLQNPALGTGSANVPHYQKTMLYIKSKVGDQKIQFVFDPEKEVLFGRDNIKCNIFINEAFVSQAHCRITSKDNVVMLQDMNSANGTYLKRGLFKKFFLINGQYIPLKSKDQIIIGSNKFKVTLFFFDMALM